MTNYYCFDFWGVYLGYIDETRAMYDPRGLRWARLDDQSRVFDADGRYRGYVDPQGSFFGENGNARGYVQGWTMAGVPFDDRRRLRGVAVMTGRATP